MDDTASSAHLLSWMKYTTIRGKAAHTSEEATAEEPCAVPKLKSRLLQEKGQSEVRSCYLKKQILCDDVCNANIFAFTLLNFQGSRKN